MSDPVCAGDDEGALRYLSANLALHRALQDASQDHRAVREDNEQFFYFVDSNVVEWHLNPARDLRLVAALPMASTKDVVSAIEFASSVVASEYIFSKQLIGSENLPCFITPYHGQELVDGLKRHVADAEKSETTSAAQRKALTRRLSEALSAFRTRPDAERLSCLFQAFAETLHKTYGSTAYHRVRMLRLLKEEQVVWADPFGDFGLDKKELRKERVKFWEEQLLKIGKSPAASDNIERDARSLCLLERLNENALTRHRPLKFVLISTDSAMHAAVDAWRRQEGLVPVRQFNFIRHPRQYTPLVTLNSSPAPDDQKAPLSELSALVSDIAFHVSTTSFSGDSHGHFPDHNLTLLRERLHGLPAEISPRLAEFGVRWQPALETAALLNADKLIHLAGDFVDVAIASLMESDVEAIFQEQMREGLRDIARGHLEFIARGQLDSMLRTLIRARAPEPELPLVRQIARSPALVRLAIPQSFGGYSDRLSHSALLTDLGNWLVDAASGDELKQFQKQCAEVPFGDAAAIACLLALRTNNWEQAAHVAERMVMSLPPNDSDRAEFAYARCLANRYGGHGLENYQRNVRRLDFLRMRSRRAGDNFGAIRSLVEIGAQCLFFAYEQALIVDPGRRTSAAYIFNVVRQAEERLSFARRLLRETDLDDVPQGLISRLKLHAFGNSLSAHLFLDLNALEPGGGQSSLRGKQASAIAHNVLKLLPEPDRIFRLSEFYALCALRLANDDDWTQARAARARALLQIFASESHQFLELDRKEIGWLQTKLLV